MSVVLVCDPQRLSFLYPVDWFKEYPDDQVVRSTQAHETMELVGEGFTGSLLCVGGRVDWAGALSLETLDKIRGPRFISVGQGDEKLGWELVEKGLFHDVLPLPASPLQVKRAWSRWQAYLDLFQRSNDSILLIDPESEAILEMNLVGEKYFGQSKDTLKAEGKAWFQLVHPDAQKEVQKTFRMGKRGYYAREIKEVIIQDIQGKELYSDISIGLVNFQGRDVVQVMFRDITAQKMAQLQLEQLSITDALTGLANRRYFDKTLEERFEEASRHGSPISLIYMDIDNFKHYNDSHGHSEGDELLKAAAALIKEKANRKYTLPARLGGEEFVVLLPRIDKLGALEVAEHIRKAIRNGNLKFSEQQPLGYLSVSVGVCEFPSDCSSHQDLLRKADEAMYNAKQTGKNRTCYFQADQIHTRDPG